MMGTRMISKVVAAGLIGCIGGIAAFANADLVQPDDAVATSEFSSSYDILQTIDGSGMPAGFGPSDEHDIYDQGNHWTTASTPALPTGAVYSFDTPQSLGAFYMWNHRADQAIDGLANGDAYDVIEFDLVLFNDKGTELFSIIGECAGIDIPHAQTFSFGTVIDDVSSIEFRIRAYLRGNFTGLAEVAFDTDVVADSQAAGDVTRDGPVNIDDILRVLAAWGDCPAFPASCCADLNHDQIVGLSDLLQRPCELVVGRDGSTLFPPR